eukprot:TRINITY_DN15577_c0_g1_i1.p1 TRINITY_DN15577_c0_g1~~TRINITY_DN15577_c0_g1_i1.p1  ORF type:complete len:608 (+),score=130.57 TRINITY_DN15577_c0_g1_i1:92-1915(+)
MAVFEDPDFPADHQSIGKHKHSHANWHRLKDLRGVSDPPVLFGRIEADAVEQGELGDCWLLAAFAAVADFPGHLKSLFEPKEYAPDGKYSIRLYDISKGWQTIVIDDQIPCLPHSGGRVPCFCQVQATGIWSLLLEKAFAKFCGSYQLLEGGGSTWAFQVLTGITDQLTYDRESGSWKEWHVSVESQKKDPARWRRDGMRATKLTSRVPNPSFSREGFFGLAAYFDQCNALLSASINGDVMEKERSDGLIERHAYSLLEVQQAHGHALVKLRNPWGGTEWNGRFSDTSKEWDMYPELKKDLKLSSGDDGQFWMAWDDFVDIFDHLKVSPGSLCVPKMSRVGGKETAEGGGAKCAQCHYYMTRVWCQSKFEEGGHGQWTRLQDGDFCFMCRRANVGLHDFRPELQRIPGIDAFQRFPRLTLPEPPKQLPVCKYGPKCYRFNPDHFSQFHHPWLRLNFLAKPYLAPPEGPSGGADSEVTVPHTPEPPAPDPPEPEPAMPEPAEPEPAVPREYTDAEVHEMLNFTKMDAWDSVLSILAAKPGIVNCRPASRNWAAIHRAAATDNMAVLLEMVKVHGADPKLPTGDGMTPLDVAKKGNCLGVIEVLTALHD